MNEARRLIGTCTDTKHRYLQMALFSTVATYVGISAYLDRLTSNLHVPYFESLSAYMCMARPESVTRFNFNANHLRGASME